MADDDGAPGAPLPGPIAPRPRGRLRTLLGYSAMLIAVVLGYLAIRSHGETLVAPPPPDGGASVRSVVTQPHGDNLFHVLLALAVVIVMARAVGSLFRRFQQPPVVGEILAGILLGPSLLGRIAPAASAFLLPKSVAPFLQVLSQVGVILYMFLVGLELDPALLRKRGHTTVAISHASIVTPFLLGAVAALFLYPRLSSSDVPFTSFSLFLGVSMSVTAFPVLARILTDRRIHKSRMGVVALTCAAVDDVTAWCLLAFVVSIVEARGTRGLLVAPLALGYIAAMVLIVRPAMVRLSRLYGTSGRLTQGVMAAVFVVLLLSSLATDVIGIHAVFGAFALGAVIPHDSGLARELTDRLEDLVVVLLLPAFFAFTGLRTQIGLVRGLDQWLICGLIIVIASIGKFGGSLVAARLTGLGWRDASALGVLMNTRGLMELIALNIGLELKVISPTLFAMLVLMALVTTFATTPLLHLITRGHTLDEKPAFVTGPQRILALPSEGRRGVLVPISNPAGMAPLLQIALAITDPKDPPPRVLALVRRPGGGVRSGLREMEDDAPPHTPILATATRAAHAAGRALDLQAMWTDDPVADIVEQSNAPDVGWLLLGFHRPVFGSDLLGGAVKQILDRAAGKPVHVGVVIHPGDHTLERVVAVVSDDADGRAALELAVRIAERRKSGSLHAVLVPQSGSEPETALTTLVKDAARSSGRWLHTDVLTERTSEQLLAKTQSDLVIMGSHLVDQLGLPLDDGPDARSIVIVQGGTPVSSSQMTTPANALPASPRA